MSTRPLTDVDRGESLPWGLIAAAVSAMAALAVTSHFYLPMSVIAAVMIASRFSHRRLPGNPLVQYGLRSVMTIFVLGLINQNAVTDSTVWYLKQEDTNIAGVAVAADLVMRAWSRRVPQRMRESMGIVLVMCGLLFAAATNSYRRLPIQLLTPIFMVCLLFSFRTFGTLQQPADAQRQRRGGLVFLRVLVATIAIAISFSAVYAVTRFEYEVTRWAMRFVNEKRGDRPEIGFNLSPQLSRVFNPEPDTTRVFLIEGQLTDPHLRMVGYDTYEAQAWLPDGINRPWVPLPIRQGETNTTRLTIQRLADTADLLVAPLHTASIASDEQKDIDPTGEVRNHESNSRLPYSADVAITPDDSRSLPPTPDGSTRAQLLSIPRRIDPRVIALAKQVAGDGEPARRVFRLQEYLRGHHEYSLSYQPVGEALNDFILNNRAAHCQYFASALAIMSRAVGVPSRYIQGFYAHESYGPGQTIVRQRDAHAWVECWLDGTGWQTFDATPSGGRPDGEFADPPAWKRWWEKLSDLPGDIRDWIATHPRWLQIAVAAGMVIGLSIWSIRALMQRRRRKPVISDALLPPAELVDLARRFDRQLTRRGAICSPHSTWRTCLPTDRPVVFDRFIDLYNQARFGERGESIGPANEVLQQIEAGGNEGERHG